MKSIQNLLQTAEKIQSIDLTQVKGGVTYVETQIDVTCKINGSTTLLYCDRRRKRLGA